jgi:WD40 repeat protein
VLPTRFPEATTLVFSPDNQHLLTVVSGGNRATNTEISHLELWNAETGAKTQNFPMLRGIAEVQFNEDGNRIGVNTWMQHEGQPSVVVGAHVFDTVTGEILFSMRPEDEGIFRPDLMQYLVTPGDYSHVGLAVYSAETGAQIYPPLYFFYPGGIRAFSPDGRYITLSQSSYQNCGGDYRALMLVALETGEIIAEIGLPSAFMGSGGDRGVFSPDSRMLAIASSYALQLWDTTTGERVVRLGISGYEDVSFNAEMTNLWSFNANGTISLWGIPSSEGH